MNPLLSVVIPTKDRYECLVVLLRVLLRYDSKDLEVVVADNSPDNRTFIAELPGLADGRLKYAHHPNPVSVIENCDRAVALASGEFVCMLGDDDGVAEWILMLARWMSMEGVDAVLGPRPIYLWPGVTSPMQPVQSSGTLTYREPKGTIRRIEVARELERVFEAGGTTMKDLPRVYHGIVRRAALDAVRNEVGSCFPGPSPDMANAVALSRHARTAYWIDFPVIITGNMPRSTGGMGTRHQHVGRLGDLTHLPSSTERDWTPGIPKFWSGPTIWAESAVKARDALGLAKPKLNFARLYAACLVFHPEYREAVTRARSIEFTNRRAAALWCALKTRVFTVPVYWRRISALVRNATARLNTGRQVRIDNVATIEECVAIINERFGSARKPWVGWRGGER